MKKAKKILYIAFATFAVSCTKMKDVNILNQGSYSDTTTASLKSATDVKLGVAVEYSNIADGNYTAIAKNEFDAITVGYSMKHGAIVKDDGTYNYTNADAIINAFSPNEVYGHTLLWHSNQNATYLKNYTGITIPAPAELMTNPGFEAGASSWSVFNTNGATITFNTGDAANAHAGTSYMKVVNPTSQTGNQWKVQVSSAAFATVPGQKYTISYWVKAASAGGSIRLSTGPTSSQYQGDQTINTTWQQVSWTITASISSTTFLFDMGQAANTYYIDDASVKLLVSAPTGPSIALKVDTALNTFATNMVNHFKSKVHQWDVVNEPLSPSGALRTSGNSSDISDKTAKDLFFWGDYLGRDFPLKAFQYAKAADATAQLFINEYGLEASATKTDSLIALVKELKARGAAIDGIGTQVHALWNSSYGLIDSMFIKLASTGLLVRISELDIRINPLFKSGFVLTDLESSYQADMYYYIINSYLKNVPKAQQAGITVWGLTDDTSWLYKSGADFPLLFNANYSRKKAYGGVLKALKGL